MVWRAFNSGITHFDLTNHCGPPPGLVHQMAAGRITSAPPGITPSRDATCMSERRETASSFGQAPAVTARPPGYPAELEQILTLRDGRPVFVRPVIPADELAFEREWREADPETLYQRFFTPQPKLDPRRLHALLHVDYQCRLALVAFAEDGRAVGIARYEGVPGQEPAEIAFVVNPAWRRLGLASALLRLLTEAARARGIRRLVALYLEDNQAMAALLAGAGFGPPQVNAGVAVTEKAL